LIATKPLFTVVMATYNRADLIGAALESVYAQSDDDFEIIVVDDASSDDTTAVVARFAARGKLRYHKNAKNAGASESRNLAIRMAAGQLITFLDSDDLLGREHFARVRAVFQGDPKLGICFCDSFVLRGNAAPESATERWVVVNSEQKRRAIDSGYRSLSDIFQFSTCFPGMTFRKAVFERIGGLKQSIFPLDDVDFTLRAAAVGFRLYYVHEPLAYYRVHDNNASGMANAVKTCRCKVKFLADAVEHYPELQSLPHGARRRLADASLELAVAQLQAGSALRAVASGCEAVLLQPGILGEAAWLLRRKITRLMGRRKLAAS
jgi:glycosyltransferase involved in cell wall biosynthesis